MMGINVMVFFLPPSFFTHSALFYAFVGFAQVPIPYSIASDFVHKRAGARLVVRRRNGNNTLACMAVVVPALLRAETDDVPAGHYFTNPDRGIP